MFEHRKEILAVQTHGSFTKAADALFVSQPALSATIRKAEEQLGFSLFDRSTHPIQPTAEGEIYIASLAEVSRLEEETQGRLLALKGLLAGQLTVGGSALFSSLFLPKLIGSFSERYPAVSVALREGDTAQLFSLLQQGKVDVVLDNCLPPDDAFQSWQLEEENLMMAFPEELLPAACEGYAITHKQLCSGCKADPVRMQLLEGAPLVMLRKGNDTADRFYRMCAQAEVSPNVVFETEQLLTAINAAAGGLGATVVSDSIVQALPYETNMLFLSLGGPHARRALNLFCSKRALAPAPKAFVEAACGAQ